MYGYAASLVIGETPMDKMDTDGDVREGAKEEMR